MVTAPDVEEVSTTTHHVRLDHDGGVQQANESVARDFAVRGGYIVLFCSTCYRLRRSRARTRTRAG